MWFHDNGYDMEWEGLVVGCRGGEQQLFPAFWTGRRFSLDLQSMACEGELYGGMDCVVDP